MFKKITALVLLMAFVTQTFSAPFILLDYYTNTSSYASNCINKAKPKIHCNGKCQMMKKMREAEKKDRENAERMAGAKHEVLSTKSFYPSLIYPELVSMAAVKNPAPYNMCFIEMSYAFFHPPQITFA